MLFAFALIFASLKVLRTTILLLLLKSTGNSFVLLYDVDANIPLSNKHDILINNLRSEYIILSKQTFFLVYLSSKQVALALSTKLITENRTSGVTTRLWVSLIH